MAKLCTGRLEGLRKELSSFFGAKARFENYDLLPFNEIFTDLNTDQFCSL